MPLQEGLYEQLINKLILSKLDKMDGDKYYIKQNGIDKADAANSLAQYLVRVIRLALSLLGGEKSIERQIELSNKIILLLQSELENDDFFEDIISEEGKILTAIFSKLDASFSDIKKHLKQITPYTRLTQSELFTGSNAGISLESEIKKEILSSDRICFLVSFIKWTGIRIFERELSEFTERGGQLKVITTSYMGATDYKAVEYLSGLKNTKLKVSYNTDNERLHAKAYLFLRNTGFHTGYIGSSNLSRSALTNGLEWNIKVTTNEVKHIIEKFQKTFATYWQDQDLLHSRYTREQILVAFGFSTFEKKSEIREGVALLKEKNTELLFITLNKSEKDFSPSTLYEDFAISETQFHWQTQNSTRPEKGKGLAYINHQKEKRKILLFVREKSEDEFGNTMGSVFLGEGKLESYSGSKPMNITWELNEPIPAFLWKDTAKMAVG